MYKEIVMRKKISSIFMIVIMLTISIVISDISSKLTFGEYRVGEYSTTVIDIVVLIFIIIQIEKCKIKYKYAIIADEFIIYKLKGNKQKIMETIKIKDIKSVDKIGKTKACLDTPTRKMYGNLKLDKDVYFCKYNNHKGTNGFYFEPSHRLINKLDVLINKAEI
ncbi:hypothetical protein [Clostridium sp. ZS2-4]|uniref:hypothetical protein n=1 Tax=Clostridium sp. ZS2-4 TaxID=2987703 RepID=UPI00227C08BD|nr:hypothetical protein [Clostridium sp. ZS2-4]MCY6354798.1 hypothetical protein [Clostridium sp. ZS2-4]